MTLTQVAGFTRSLIIFFVLFIVVSITGFVGYSIWHARYLASLPPVEEKPTLTFGNLNAPNFPKVDASSSNFSYSIDTVDGNLPNFGKIAKVFIIPPLFATFLAGEKSQDLAQRLNLIPIGQILSETKYKFVNTDASLIINLDSGNFAYRKESSKSATTTIEDQDSTLIVDFKNLLTSINVLKEDLKNGPTKVKMSADKQTAFISIWPQNVDGKPIVTTQPDIALVNAQITKSGKDIENYLSIDFTFWPTDTSNFATYPIKSTSEALEDLKSGKGVIITPNQKPQISITSVDLGYFESNNYSPFLQPVYIFNGPNFQALVSAINGQYIKQEDK